MRIYRTERFGFAPRFAALRAERLAATALEYALLAAIMAMAVITGLSLLGTGIGTSYGKISGALDAAAPASPSNAASGTSSPAAPVEPNPGTAGTASGAGVAGVDLKKLGS